MHEAHHECDRESTIARHGTFESGGDPFPHHGKAFLLAREIGALHESSTLADRAFSGRSGAMR
jgi:hypothetical protein